MTNQWMPSTTTGFVKHTRFTRNGVVKAQRRGWRALAVRRDPETRKESVEKCGHAHTKRAQARLCAEALCRELNAEGTS